MADPSAGLRDHIARIRTLGTQLAENVAPPTAVALKRQIDASIAAGVSPDGTPLRPTQDGRVPLRNAAQAARVRAVGTTVIARVKGAPTKGGLGVEERHHLGAVRGGKGGRLRRPLLPTDEIPDEVVVAIGEIVEAEADAIMGAS